MKVNTKQIRFTVKHLCQGLFFNKAVDLSLFEKRLFLTQVFLCEFCEYFKNIFFTKHLRVTISPVLHIQWNVYSAEVFMKENPKPDLTLDSSPITINYTLTTTLKVLFSMIHHKWIKFLSFLNTSLANWQNSCIT